jgi:hypothetical protein
MKTRSYLSSFFLLTIFISSCQKLEIVPKTFLLDDLASAKNSGGPADLSTGLFAYYPFSGNANDLSGNLLHGTAQNLSMTTDRKGKRNAAYYFDNKTFDSRITLPVDPRFSITGDFTISFWVMPMEYADVSVNLYRYIGILSLIEQYGFSGGRTSESPLIFTMGFGTRYWNGQGVGALGNLTLNQWKHCTVTYEKTTGTIRHYFNGVLAKQEIGQDLRLSVSPFNVIVGGYFNFTGKLDELRYYSRALTPTDIKALANQ